MCYTRYSTWWPNKTLITILDEQMYNSRWIVFVLTLCNDESNPCIAFSISFLDTGPSIKWSSSAAIWWKQNKLIHAQGLSKVTIYQKTFFTEFKSLKLSIINYNSKLRKLELTCIINKQLEVKGNVTQLIWECYPVTSWTDMDGHTIHR